MHQAVIEVGTKVCRNIKEAREDIQVLRREMITLAGQNGSAAGGRQYPSFRRLEGTGDLSRRALPPGAGRNADAGARQSRFRIARTRRHRGPEYRHPHHELDAVFPAAYSGAVQQFAFLDGHSDRLQVLPLQGVSSAFRAPAFPTSLPTGPTTRLSSTCWSRRAASTTARKSGGTSGLIRASARWKCVFAISRCAWTRPWPSRR